jgi:hypothetical protein
MVARFAHLYVNKPLTPEEAWNALEKGSVRKLSAIIETLLKKNSVLLMKRALFMRGQTEELIESLKADAVNVGRLYCLSGDYLCVHYARVRTERSLSNPTAPVENLICIGSAKFYWHAIELGDEMPKAVKMGKPYNWRGYYAGGSRRIMWEPLNLPAKGGGWGPTELVRMIEDVAQGADPWMPPWNPDPDSYARKNDPGPPPTTGPQG